jgi:hypothetical protein
MDKLGIKKNLFIKKKNKHFLGTLILKKRTTKHKLDFYINYYTTKFLV